MEKQRSTELPQFLRENSEKRNQCGLRLLYITTEPLGIILRGSTHPDPRPENTLHDRNFQTKALGKIWEKSQKEQNNYLQSELRAKYGAVFCL